MLGKFRPRGTVGGVVLVGGCLRNAAERGVFRFDGGLALLKARHILAGGEFGEFGGEFFRLFSADAVRFGFRENAGFQRFKPSGEIGGARRFRIDRFEALVPSLFQFFHFAGGDQFGAGDEGVEFRGKAGALLEFRGPLCEAFGIFGGGAFRLLRRGGKSFLKDFGIFGREWRQRFEFRRDPGDFRRVILDGSCRKLLKFFADGFVPVELFPEGVGDAADGGPTGLESFVLFAHEFLIPEFCTARFPNPGIAPEACKRFRFMTEKPERVKYSSFSVFFHCRFRSPRDFSGKNPSVDR